jgi:MFS family permease
MRDTSLERPKEIIEYGALQTTFPNEAEAVDDADNNEVSYWRLLRKNREYRFFISSYLITHCGEWLTYIASIDFIEGQLKTSDTTSRTTISILVLVRLLPNVLLSTFGGTLADAYDRRKLMISLDVAGAICALFFVVACQLKSISLIYLATFLQQCIAGLYQPSSSSMTPLLVSDDKELQKATTLAGLAWSGTTAFGAAASGFIVYALGSRACFCK